MSWLISKISIRSLMLRVTIISFVVFGVVFGAGADVAKAAGLFEGFEDLSALLANGWVTVNHSDPGNAAVPGWFQCTGTGTGTDVAPAYAGTTNSCVSADYHAGTGVSTLNVWLIGPQRTFNNGDTISFYTRTVTGNPYPDRMQVRLSTSGASTNVGTSGTDVGDFTTLLLDINDTLQVGVYPDIWIQYSATISGLSGPTSGRFAFRYFVENGGPSGANSYTVGIDSLAVTPAQHTVDFDGDGKTDPAIVRSLGASGQATWYIQKSSDGSSFGQQWGIGTDFYVPADYDGDHKTDIAVWRQGPPFGASFYIFQSATNTVRADQFGQTLDDPTVVGDYDGDGKADPAVYREGAAAGDHSFWYFRASTGPLSGQIIYNQYGQNGDFPAPGDYNGDGKADFCVRRNAGGGPALFFTRLGNGGVASGAGDSGEQFGLSTDFITPGDYDGDGKTDIAVTRSIGGQFHWYYDPSSMAGLQVVAHAWGLSATDFQTQGDYDGDGKTDVAVWRPSANPGQSYFYVLGSTAGEMSPIAWGQSGDYPVANYNTH